MGTGIACACLPPLRPLFFRSSASKPSHGFSSARRRYYGIHGWSGKGVGSPGVSGASRTEDNPIEVIPLKSQPAEPSRVMTPRAERAWLPDEHRDTAEERREIAEERQETLEERPGEAV